MLIMVGFLSNKNSQGILPVARCGVKKNGGENDATLLMNAYHRLLAHQGLTILGR
jgi:hypothetical protein